MKPFFTSLVFIFTMQFLAAQKTDLIVKSSDKGLYLEHKVVAKESFYALGRLYNVSPKYLAAYNKLDLNKGLQIDQKLRIPLTDTNFIQKGVSGTPVFYKADDDKDLEKISAANKNVPVENLKIWNNLFENKAKKGSKLIIGFLLSKEMPSGTLVVQTKNMEMKADDKPADNPVTLGDQKTEIKEEKKEAEAEIKAEKKEEKKDPPPVVKEERKVSIEGQGYFKKDFEQQIKIIPVSKDETVTSGIFKTTSGWADAKYYLLIDKVSPGTIVRLINPSNNKSIYAKVLGEMAGIRQNQNYNIRISNAGASALEITEQDKFIVKVNY